MKNFYKCFYFFLCWLGLTVPLKAQTPINLGKTADLLAAYRTKANAKTTNAISLYNQIKHSLPGHGALTLHVNVRKKEGPTELFMGSIAAQTNGSFFLKAAGNNLSGNIILPDQKKAYQYLSTSNGQAYLQEVDIDKVICVGLEPQLEPKGILNNQAAAPATKVVPMLESLPGASAVVLLDFDGQTVSGTPWNGGNPINAAPSTLTTQEIIEAWEIISEDYRPYALNITTNESVFLRVPAERRMRVIFTPTYEWYKPVGGTAYVGSFNWNDNSPCWVFNTGAKGAGDTGSHEVGHTLKLHHDGRISPVETYFYGQENWAPIMGASFYSPQAQWSKGEYPSADNTEDDLAIIATNGFNFRADDHSNTYKDATRIIKDVNGTVLPEKNKGVITTRTDTDVFSFTTEGGILSLTVTSHSSHPDLDVRLTLKNEALTTVAVADSASISASMNRTLTAGTYYLYIDGAKGTLGANSNYGSLGEYFISGSITSNYKSAYCIPAIKTACGNNISITDFSLHTLVNNASGCNGNKNAYINYNPAGSLTATLERGQKYPIRLQSNSAYQQGFGIWIDYNSDGDFNDAGEFVYTGVATAKNILNGTITIPMGVTDGVRRLRVRTQNQNPFASTGACTATDNGETEDYTITIKEPVVSNIQWDSRFGGSGDEGFSVVIRTPDGGYLSGGSSPSTLSGDKTQSSRGRNDYWIVKSDKDGKKLWDKRYGGSQDDYLATIVPTLDGGYLLGGTSLSGNNGDKSEASRGDRDFWLVKISGTGAKLWDKRYGGSGFDELKQIQELANGNIVLAGNSNSPSGGNKSQNSRGGKDYWVIKINGKGSPLWDKRYGGSLDENLESITLTLNGGFLLGGSSLSGKNGDKTQASQGGSDYWLVRVDGNGNKVWDKRYGGAGEDNLMDLGSTGTSTGNFFLAGHSTSGIGGDKSQTSQGGKDFWMIKINDNGTKIFDKRFGGNGQEGLRKILLTPDGGYLLAGRSESGVSGDKTQTNQGSSDYWIVKTSSTGIKEWDKRFGGSSYDEIRTALVTSDGGYLLGGRSNSGVSADRTQPSQGGIDYWLVKVAPISIGAPKVAARKTTPAQASVVNKELGKLNAFPNPFAGRLTIHFTLPQTEPAQVKVFDLQGKEIVTLFNGQAQANQKYEVEWQASNKPAGMYLLQLQTPTLRQQQKLLLTK
ncbi:GEVED domain-containing protein [Adhaeribacter radiodurans]|uniref:T9SS type A sorting domain-containing protein n=1 Tax=Adhaeribacter radiodurans TaxID=2745197 RepID=A0A7L7LEX6_9BACT|nr:GEVED domain-containing protein [Adhaeribacter radiodurans]QMU31035.1 T9SS type A sorting domain-containing protein [Adhaeribacter radiodurans]